MLHLGDHDPSGIDMTRDNGDRLDVFAENGVEVRRLALNADQVQQYGPPPNPSKLTDSRAAGYLEEHGNEAWELDALEPSVISDLIEDELKSLIDDAGWATTEERQERERDLLRRLVDQAKSEYDLES